MKDKYLKCSKIFEAKLKEISRYSSLDIDAHMVTSLTGRSFYFNIL